MKKIHLSIITKSIILGLVLSVLLSQTAFAVQCDQMSTKLLRLHILANSDSDEDQQLKLNVRDQVLAQAGYLFEHTNTKEEAKVITQEHIKEIQAIAQSYIKEQGYNYTVSCQLKKLPFNTRHYENITLPAGEYDALQVVIGQGEGQNWWCVMFPPMCISSAEETTDMGGVLSESEQEIIENEVKYEYKFKAVEVFQDIVSFFNGEE